MLSTVVTSLLLTSVLAAPPTVTILPAGTRAVGVSDDGKVVTGTASNGAFRWTVETGLVVIPGILAGSNVAGSGDGTGLASDVQNAAGKENAATWNGSSWDELPTTGLASCDAFLLGAYDMNNDGSVVVGLAWYTGCKARAFRWDAANGVVDLGTLVTNRSTRANAVNGVGNIIVGWQDLASGQRLGARWIDGVESYLPKYVVPGGASYDLGEALGCNLAGDQIVGYNVINAPGGPAWHFNSVTNTVEVLPNLAQFGTQDALALGVSADGSTAVGTSGGSPLARTAIIWINGVGQNLKTYIESKGGTIGSFTQLGTANDITSDGRTIVGWGFGPGQPPGWIVHFPADCVGDLNSDGSVGAEDLAQLLGAWGGRGPADLSGNGTVGPEDLALLLGAWGSCPG